MQDREMPTTQKKMLEELWGKLIGTNGGGLVERTGE